MTRPPEKKRALLIFSKYPEPGRVKTRLTYLKGGPMMPEVAAEFFTYCLFDVVDISMAALQELQRINDDVCAKDPDHYHVKYDFYVSTTPEEKVLKMRELFAREQWPMDINFLVDNGSTFDEHFNDAFQQLFALGYESIVSIGGDIPTIPKSHITRAFEWLAYFQSIGKPGFVQAPCQECGTSLVGFSYNTPIDHTGVYYNLDGTPALDAYVQKLRQNNIPSAYFSPVADIDEESDLAHAISCMFAIEEAARYQPDLYPPRRVLDWVRRSHIKVTTPPNADHDPRQYVDGKELEETYEEHLAEKEKASVENFTDNADGNLKLVGVVEE